jgi:hypothetical protein
MSTTACAHAHTRGCRRSCFGCRRACSVIWFCPSRETRSRSGPLIRRRCENAPTTYQREKPGKWPPLCDGSDNSARTKAAAAYDRITGRVTCRTRGCRRLGTASIPRQGLRPGPRGRALRSGSRAVQASCCPALGREPRAIGRASSVPPLSADRTRGSLAPIRSARHLDARSTTSFCLVVLSAALAAGDGGRPPGADGAPGGGLRVALRNPDRPHCISIASTNEFRFRPPVRALRKRKVDPRRLHFREGRTMTPEGNSRRVDELDRRSDSDHAGAGRRLNCTVLMRRRRRVRSTR